MECRAATHDDVIKWKYFPRHWSFVWWIHRWPVNSPQKGQWRWALMFSLIWAWINGWVNNGEAGDLRRHRDHYDVTVMICLSEFSMANTYFVWNSIYLIWSIGISRQFVGQEHKRHFMVTRDTASSFLTYPVVNWYVHVSDQFKI